MRREIRLVQVGLLVPAGLLLAAPLSGCGETRLVDNAQNAVEAPAHRPAVGFTVDPLPEAYEIRSAVHGEGEPAWSSDCCGGVHPKVVLVPNDWAGGEDQRWVIVESFDSTDNQGGARQEIPTYLIPEKELELEVNGQAAVGSELLPPGEEAMEEPGRLAFIAVDTTAPAVSEFGLGDHGFIVTGFAKATVEELMPFAEAVREAPIHLPVVIDPPDGWRVLASLTGEQVGSTYGYEPGTGSTGSRLITLAGPEMTQSEWISITSLPGNTQTAEALAVAASSTLWSARPNRIAHHSQGDLSWHTVQNNYPRVYATINEVPFVLSGPRRLVQDNQFVADLLGSTKEVDNPTWEALVGQTARTANAAPLGTRLLIQGGDDELAWSVQTTGREPMPATTIPGTPAATPRLGDIAELVIQPTGQPATVHRWGSESWPVSSGLDEVSVFVVNELGTVPGWVLIVDAPPAATQAVYFDGSTSHTIELQSVEGRALGGKRFTDTSGQIGLLHKSVRLLDADGSKI